MDDGWSFAVVSAYQRFVCASTMSGPLDDALRAARDLRDAIPPPPDHAASRFLRATLLELAIRWGLGQHRRMADRCPVRPCVVPSFMNAPDFWKAPCSTKVLSDIDAFVACITAITHELNAIHGTSLAQRAADIIRAQAGPISIDSTARRLGAHPATLRRAFQREFKMSAREFLTRLRVERAEALLHVDHRAKVEPIAMAVGWRTKRGLYRAFRQVRGHTPGGARKNIA